jgi:hypothetical protein
MQMHQLSVQERMQKLQVQQEQFMRKMELEMAELQRKLKSDQDKAAGKFIEEDGKNQRQTQEVALSIKKGEGI